MRLMLKILRQGGVNGVVAENLALRQQLIVVSRRHKRMPRLSMWERLGFAFITALILPKRLLKTAIVIKPSTLLKFHKALISKKYTRLFSRKTHRKPGPKGPSKQLIKLILEMKEKNPNFGYLRIAMQISDMLGSTINKDIVRRVLNKYHNHIPGDDGPSWLSFIGNSKDSLWSLDFFRCESIILKSHWVMIVMDQFTREILGFSVHAGDLDGIVVCRMFNKILSGKKPPKYLSTDHDPLFRFNRWQANLRILKIEAIKSIPYTPTSHPFIERAIGTCRRELLDKTFFWNASDLQNKLVTFQQFYNENRCHFGISGNTPDRQGIKSKKAVVDINHYRWKKHCRGLFQLPRAA